MSFEGPLVWILITAGFAFLYLAFIAVYFLVLKKFRKALESEASQPELPDEEPHG